ncbi:MAG: peptidoglycan-associated lipoprotein Pal [Endomicrobiales bacterium]|jgi:peptidoglycan-associated lipoprotein
MKHMVLLLLLPGLIMVGCAKRQIVRPVTPFAPVQAAPAETEQSDRYSDWKTVPELMAVYFNYDKSELLPEARKTLQTNAEFLKEHAEASILVEGNCDERGTAEYNLTLGDRRASAVKEYYGLLGVPKERIATISYGSEKPVDPGHNEAAWYKNRRAETKVRGVKMTHSTPAVPQ